jgi:hypothetical protein
MLGCFGLLRNRSVCFVCFEIGSKHRNKLKFFLFGFTKQTETNAKQILFRFVSVRTEIYFCLFRGTLIEVHRAVGRGGGISNSHNHNRTVKSVCIYKGPAKRYIFLCVFISRPLIGPFKIWTL